jgi:hypothetical protein
MSVTGSGIELLGILTVAADLLYAGRVPNLKATVRKLLRWPPSVKHGRASGSIDLTVHSATQAQSVGHVDLEPDTAGVVGQLHRLERRIDELRANLEREVTARADAIARLERSIQPTLQSLQNEVTELRRDVTKDRARATGRPWIAWAGIAAFVFGLGLNTFGAFMAVNCR